MNYTLTTLENGHYKVTAMHRDDIMSSLQEALARGAEIISLKQNP